MKIYFVGLQFGNSRDAVTLKEYDLLVVVTASSIEDAILKASAAAKKKSVDIYASYATEIDSEFCFVTEPGKTCFMTKNFSS